MQSQYQLQPSINAITESGSFNDLPQKTSVFTVTQFAKKNPAFTEAALRNLIFKAESRESSRGTIHGNGLIETRALVRYGRKILIHEARFFEWLDSIQSGVEAEYPKSKKNANQAGAK